MRLIKKDAVYYSRISPVNAHFKALNRSCIVCTVKAKKNTVKIYTYIGDRQMEYASNQKGFMNYCISLALTLKNKKLAHSIELEYTDKDGIRLERFILNGVSYIYCLRMSMDVQDIDILGIDGICGALIEDYTNMLNNSCSSKISTPEGKYLYAPVYRDFSSTIDRVKYIIINNQLYFITLDEIKSIFSLPSSIINKSEVLPVLVNNILELDSLFKISNCTKLREFMRKFNASYSYLGLKIMNEDNIIKFRLKDTDNSSDPNIHMYNPFQSYGRDINHTSIRYFKTQSKKRVIYCCIKVILASIISRELSTEKVDVIVDSLEYYYKADNICYNVKTGRLVLALSESLITEDRFLLTPPELPYNVSYDKVKTITDSRKTLCDFLDDNHINYGIERFCTNNHMYSVLVVHSRYFNGCPIVQVLTDGIDTNIDSSILDLCNTFGIV